MIEWAESAEWVNNFLGRWRGQSVAVTCILYVVAGPNLFHGSLPVNRPSSAYSPCLSPGPSTYPTTLHTTGQQPVTSNKAIKCHLLQSVHRGSSSQLQISYLSQSTLGIFNRIREFIVMICIAIQIWESKESNSFSKLSLAQCAGWELSIFLNDSKLWHLKYKLGFQVSVF